MKKKIERNYLEINSLNDLSESKDIHDKYNFQLIETKDFQLNKFFYKNNYLFSSSINEFQKIFFEGGKCFFLDIFFNI